MENSREKLLKSIMEGQVCERDGDHRGMPRLEYVEQNVIREQYRDSCVRVKRKTDSGEEWKLAANQSSD